MPRIAVKTHNIIEGDIVIASIKYELLVDFIWNSFFKLIFIINKLTFF